MAKKTCSKGHIYDSSIYGDICPFCPTPESGKTINIHAPDLWEAGNTELNAEAKTSVGGNANTRPTVPLGDRAGVIGGTVIRPADPGASVQSSGRRITGILVSYDTLPTGQVFNLYEGRNYIGRDASGDICIPSDSQISGKHLSILFRPADGKFKYRDEQSSNGTYINGQLTDEGELHTNDVIRLGSTRLVFMAIQQIS